MMHLHFTPVRSDAALTVERSGATLLLNGTAFDFGPLPEGAELPAEAIDSDWITDTVHRTDGVLHVPLILPHGPLGAGQTATVQVCPVDQDGPVALPAAIIEEGQS